VFNVGRLATTLPEKYKMNFMQQAETAPEKGELLYILPNAKAEKKALCVLDTIIATSAFRDSFTYYTLAHVPSERMSTSPVMNEQGELVGLLQMPVGESKNSYVIDAHFVSSLSIGPMDAGDADLNSILIPKRLPDDESAASSFLYLLGARDTTGYLSYIDDFIGRFPKSTNGYIMKAEELVRRKNYAEADAAYTEGLNQEDTKKDELHFSLSKAIYSICQDPDYQTYSDWTLERASNEAKQAFELNPLPFYTNQLGQCLYAEKKYDEACSQFLNLANTNLRSADVFLYAAQCKQKLSAPDEEILALQDSAVSCFTQPLPQAAANAILLRANTKARMGKAREAVMDYNEYEHLMAGRLSAAFYYEREQQEIKCRMYPAAMNDIERAIRLQPKEPLFHAECAALNYRVGQTDEAIQAAEKAIALDDTFPDPYRIIGVCYSEKGDVVKARKYLQKAIELGDTMAQGVLDKISGK
jgi:tetratricopeptide (TPR) repeat protein